MLSVSILALSWNWEIFIFLTGWDDSILLFMDISRLSFVNRFVDKFVLTNKDEKDVEDKGVIDEDDKQFEANDADDFDKFDLEIERDIELRSFLLE